MRARLALISAVLVVTGGLPVPAQAASAHNPTRPAAGGDQSTGDSIDPERRDRVLPPGWRTSDDEALLMSGDAGGLHVLVATQRSGYAWHTVATLREPGFETDEWIGNGCLTASGRRAVVVYAPRQFTNRSDLARLGGFVAVIDVRSGQVRKLPVTASLAYFDPGCGADETAVLTQEGGDQLAGTRLYRLDTPTGGLGRPVTTAGQLSSAIPLRNGIAAARGGIVVGVDSLGRQTALATTEGVAFDLRADAEGALVYLDHNGPAVRVRRTLDGASRTLATGSLGRIALAQGGGGRALLTGTDIHPQGTLPATLRTVAAPSTRAVSSGGALAVQLGEAGPGAAEVTGTVLATGSAVRFSVPTNQAGHADGAAVSPALGGSATDPWDADRFCAVPRNDPLTQVYQPTARQVEWAVDEAVQGALTTARPAGWKHDGLPAYSPQGLFPPLTLAGGDNDLPPQIMLGVLAQESNLAQASWHALSGEYGNPLVGNFYGQTVNSDGSYGWSINFANSDCGYGIAQITDGMRLAGHERPGETALPVNQQRAIAMDYATNIAAAVRTLQGKWNDLYNAGLLINDGDPSGIENWYYAAWAYNSGLHPDLGDGSPWGLGWANNPINPHYKPDRTPFLEVGYDDARTPQFWPYQEKVIGWAGHPIVTVDGAGYVAAWWGTIGSRNTAKPPIDLFCDVSNACYPGQTFPNNYQPGEPAGPCADRNLLCWYHRSASWKDCSNEGACGTGLIRFDTSYPEQPDGTHYPPDCTLAGLPAGSLVVDDLPDSISPVYPGCGRPFTDAGTFALSFNADASGQYPGKIDLHQLGGGLDGHFWFAHTQDADHSPQELKVTGTWTLSRPLNGWARVFVHLPDHGAVTRQAAYTIMLGGSTSKTRYLPQRVGTNAWVSLGVFPFAGATAVQLNNFTGDGNGTEDIAWDAVAFQPLPGKPRDIVVALGDSYTSGENASGPGGVDYYPGTDVDGGLPTEDLCHRSRLAWPRKTVLPDSPANLGTRADNLDPATDFHMVACAGATTGAIFGTDSTEGEIAQLTSGYVDENTTLVLLTIGGNDARFYDILTDCDDPTKVLGDCQDDTLGTDTAPLSQAEPDLITGRVRDGIRDTLKRINALAPTAKIVLAGYPAIFKADNTECPGTQLLNTVEQAWLNDMANLLDTTEQSVVAELAAGDLATYQQPIPVTYADPRAAFAGKGVCGSPEQVSGLLIDKSPGEIQDRLIQPFSNQSFHPNPTGTDAYGSVVTATMVNLGAGPVDSYGGTTTTLANIRGGPGTSYPLVGSLASGTPVRVYCTATGTKVNNTTVWDYVGQGYVTDAYVNTGYSVPIAQPCGTTVNTGASVEVSQLPGCSVAGPNTDGNYGATYSPTGDWFLENNPSGCGHAYYYTYGNGPIASADSARWGYYPGAYGRCSLYAVFPPPNGHSFDPRAHYQVLTGAGHNTVIADVWVDQTRWTNGVDALLGTFTADGSGYLGVRLDDTSPDGGVVRVVAGTVGIRYCHSLG